MKPADAPLTLTHASVVRPPAVSTVASWSAEAEVVYTRGERPVERELAEMLFAQAGCDARELARAEAPGRFRVAREMAHGDLSVEAVRRLAEQPGARHALARCEVAICALSSLDASTMFESLAGRVAMEAGAYGRPHFSVSQLQGASLGGALQVIEAMVGSPGAGALFVAAERWPLPFPRHWGGATVLGDASAALWLTRDPAPGLRYVGGWQKSFDPFVHNPARDAAGSSTPSVCGPLDDYEAMLRSRVTETWGRPLRPRREALLEAAAAVIEEGLAERRLAAADLHGWVCSGLGADVEGALQRRFGGSFPFVAEPAAEDGYLCAAATPALLGDLLAPALAGAFPPGALFLSWGASFGGTVGAQLWAAPGLS